MADHPTDDRIDEERAGILHLRAQLANLDKDVRRAQQHIDLTMRGQLRCRACNCRRIAHAPKVLDRADASTRENMALFQPSFWSTKTQGELEAYVCTACGLVEWWVKDPGAVQPHEELLVILDGAPDSTDPYR